MRPPAPGRSMAPSTSPTRNRLAGICNLAPIYKSPHHTNHTTCTSLGPLVNTTVPDTCLGGAPDSSVLHRQKPSPLHLCVTRAPSINTESGSAAALGIVAVSCCVAASKQAPRQLGAGPTHAAVVQCDARARVQGARAVTACHTLNAYTLCLAGPHSSASFTTLTNTSRHLAQSARQYFGRPQLGGPPVPPNQSPRAIACPAIINAIRSPPAVGHQPCCGHVLEITGSGVYRVQGGDP